MMTNNSTGGSVTATALEAGIGQSADLVEVASTRRLLSAQKRNGRCDPEDGGW